MVVPSRINRLTWTDAGSSPILRYQCEFPVAYALSCGAPIVEKQMSGSGGGGGGDWRPTPTPVPATPSKKKPPGSAKGGGGGGGGITPPDPCNIIEVTNLNSVNAAVLATLRVGDQLDVVLQPGPPQRVLAQINGNTAGSITSRSHPQLIVCMSRGFTYQAEVVALQGAICQVRIHP